MTKVVDNTQQDLNMLASRNRGLSFSLQYFLDTPGVGASGSVPLAGMSTLTSLVSGGALGVEVNFLSAHAISALAAGTIKFYPKINSVDGSSLLAVTLSPGTTKSGTVGNVRGTTSTSQVWTLNSAAATAGTFTLTFNYNGSLTQTTSAIAYNATAGNVQSALTALASIGAGNVVCGGGPLPGSNVTITFQGQRANNPWTVSGDFSGLTGTPFSLTNTTPGVAPTNLDIECGYTTDGSYSGGATPKYGVLMAGVIVGRGSADDE